LKNVKNTFVFAKLSYFDSLGLRLGGPGLGNLLFPWARSVVFANKYNIKRINTTWPTLKIGPILRGEKDKRFYSDLFIENQNIGGIKKFLLLNFSKHIEESNKESIFNKTNFYLPRVVIFKGMEGLFKPILNERDIVSKELLNIVAPIHKQKILNHNKKAINVHIRMGDFANPPSEEFLRKGHWNYRLPLKWYISIINKIRKSINYDMPVNVFSDGKDDELKEILQLPNVKRCYYGSAISDMLALSKGVVLIASASTFSQWASYLGQIPTIWYPGVHRHKLFINKDIFEGEIDYNDQIPLILKNFIIKELKYEK